MFVVTAVCLSHFKVYADRDDADDILLYGLVHPWPYLNFTETVRGLQTFIHQIRVSTSKK